LAHHDPLGTSCISSAMGFLEANGFLSQPGFGASQVFFEPTREEKLARIAAQGCNVFIDDLPEVLLHPDFPAACERFLFSSSPHEGLKNFFILARLA